MRKKQKVRYKLMHACDIRMHMARNVAFYSLKICTSTSVSHLMLDKYATMFVKLCLSAQITHKGIFLASVYDKQLL